MNYARRDREYREQPSLFGAPVPEPEPVLHRPSDPQASVSGAQHIAGKLPSLHEIFVEQLVGRSPLTAAEVADYAKRQYGRQVNAESVRKRAKELVGTPDSPGVVTVAGSRPCRITGMDATTYTLRRRDR